jgi:HSP20 family protein
MMDEIDELLNSFPSVDQAFAKGPIIHGYSVTIGPDGVPVIREFGNARYPANDAAPQVADALEPLTEVIDGDKEVRVIAEIPGVTHDSIKVSVKGSVLSIDVATNDRKYHKTVELPAVALGAPVSTYNNGIFEVRLPKK